MNLTTALLAAVCVLSFGLAHAHAEEKKEKPLRIKWESVEGIIQFNVQMKDAGGGIVLDRTVNTNYIDFVLPPGKYQIRIGAINKFEKTSFWTDWDEIEIRKSEKSKIFSNAYAANVGLTIRGGLAYSMILPNLNKKYNDSLLKFQYMAYVGSVGFNFGNSKYINANNVIKYMGIELDGSFCTFDDRYNPTFKSSLSQMTVGINLFFRTQLSIPLQFYLRLGGGAAYTYQKFTKYNIASLTPIPYQVGSIKSLDPYAKIGVSMEINFLYPLSLNIGVDYFNIFYQDETFMSMRYFVMLGVRI